MAIGFDGALGTGPGASEDPLLGSLWIGVLSAAALTAAGWVFVSFFRRCDIRKKIDGLKIRREASFDELEKRLRGPDGGDLVTPGRQAIRKLSFAELRLRLRSGALRAAEVLDAYAACALAVTRQVNCVAEFIEEADQWAAALDDLGPGNGGPLHGIPVSIKENFGLAGHDSTYGIGKRIGMPSVNDSAVVAVLKSLGAVPFCRTNIPQTMLSFGSGNPVYGRTENPYQAGRTTGGSSAGEGCLIGAGGSLLGLGSDAGGSVRIPAAFCGCVSLKPTVGRLSALGMHEPLNDLAGMSATPGFLARGTDALEAVFEEVTRSSLLRKVDLCQPDLKRIKMGNPEETRSLVVGFCDDDGYFPPTPGVRRAVSVAKSVLEKRGHRLVPFAIPDAGYAFHLYTELLKADGLKQFREKMKGEPVDPSVKMNSIAAMVPHVVNKLLAPVVSCVSPKTAMMLAGGARSSADLWTTVHEVKEYRHKLTEAMRDAGLDVLLCPSFGIPAPTHESCSFLLTACCYTALFNVVDFPAGIVPVSFEDEDDQGRLEEYPTAGDKMYADAKKATRGAVGLPLAVQIAGLPYAESTVLQAMKEIETGLRESGSEPSWLHSRDPWKLPHPSK